MSVGEKKLYLFYLVVCVKKFTLNCVDVFLSDT